MKAYAFDKFGLENLREVTCPDPSPGPGEIVVRLYATSMNYRDLLVIEGSYLPRLKMPIIPLSDAAGVVEAVGAGVTRFAPGDRVMTTSVIGWSDGPPTRLTTRSMLGGPLDGTLRERIALPQHAAVRMPSHLSFEEAAAVPCAAVTAWSALITYGSAKPGERALILGTGGVACFAIQIAKLLGLRTIVLSSSDAKLARAMALGAQQGINYTSVPDWDNEVLRLTGGEGVEHVIEVGGATTLARSIRATRPGGSIYLVGILTGGGSEVDLTPLVMRNIRLQGLLMGGRERLEAVCRAIEAHALKPVIDRIVPFADAPEAYRWLKQGHHMGKVVISIST